ncbi:MAG: PfkB family carbohydrate kinase [Planctomycetota bacterium]
MIVATGLTPAWQHILVFDEFALDAVNRCVETHWTSSGKVLNVAIGLHHLTKESRVIALVGGQQGREIDGEFEGYGMDRRWVETRASTRVCTTILDRGAEKRGADASDAGIQVTELVENGPPLEDGDYDRFLATFEEGTEDADVVVIAGSLPRGTPTSCYRDLMDRCDARVVIDGRGAELLAALPAGPEIVKPNREELERTLGRAISSEADLVRAMAEIQSAGAKNVIVSQGSDALCVLSKSEGFFRVVPPKIERVCNPIGCGDSMAAGLGWGLSRGDSIEQCARIGVAVSIQNLEQVLPSRLDPQRALEMAGTYDVTR